MDRVRYEVVFAGVHAPAFVERARRPRPGASRACVAGVHAPAFVERGPRRAASSYSTRVSPGFTPRPSLSDAPGPAQPTSSRAPRVAGVHAPAFVERRSGTAYRPRSTRVAGVHAPAFVERSRARRGIAASTGVAGVHAPAFVERTNARWGSASPRCVAGVHAPAFVERRPSGPPTCRPTVSPGFTPRPSLSVPGMDATYTAPTGVAGVHAPAFVERG